MYHPVGIEKLSQAQISKLIKGHRIRVKHGNGHQVHLSAEQAKKLMSAHRKGCGMTMQFDPYQQEMHGCGIFDSAKSFASSAGKALAPVAISAGKAVAPVLIDAGSNALKSYVAGQGVARSAPRRSAPRRGRGIGADIFKSVAPVLVDVGASALKKQIGSGKKSAPKRRGRGIGADIFKSVAPVLVDAGASALKKQMGSGAYEALMQVQGGLEKAGQPFESTIGVNPARLGFNVGQAIAPHIVGRGKGKKGKKGGALNVAGGALYNAGYSQGQGAIGGVIGNALGSAFIPF